MELEEDAKEETGQDEDILTFEEFKQRRMLEVQQHHQEEMKNTGELIGYYSVYLCHHFEDTNIIHTITQLMSRYIAQLDTLPKGVHNTVVYHVQDIHTRHSMKLHMKFIMVIFPNS